MNTFAHPGICFPSQRRGISGHFEGGSPAFVGRLRAMPRIKGLHFEQKCSAITRYLKESVKLERRPPRDLVLRSIGISIVIVSSKG
jgi:hypothetical protein